MYSKLAGMRFFTFLWIAGVYLLTRNPNPGFGDSLGFILHASAGFDPATNATSHFLYINLLHLLTICFPFTDVITLASLFSVIMGIWALERLYQLACMVAGEQKYALAAVLIMAFSFSWWRQVVTIEVYAFFCFCVLNMWVRIFRDVDSGQYTRMPAAALWLGLCLLTHIQSVLLFPLFAVYLWWGRMNIRGVMIAILPPVLALLFLFLSPLVFHLNTPASVLFDNRMGAEVMGIDPVQLLKGIFRSLGYWAYNFHVFLPLAIIGVVRIWRESRRLAILLIGGGLPFWLFAMRYNVSDNYVFFLVPYFALAVFSAAGIKRLIASIRSKWQEKAVYLLPFVMSILLYFFVWKVAAQVPGVRDMASGKEYKGGIAFYFWPGQAGMPDPLEIARKIRDEEIAPIPDFERYPVAVEYLERSNP
ncbi:MAG: hypothetical protein R3C61_16515 [Bacteroidia bacterium]